MRDERGLLQAVLRDGRFLIALTGIALVLSGGFAIFQSVSGCAIGIHFAVGCLNFFHLLPAFLGLMIFVVADALLWIGRKL